MSIVAGRTGVDGDSMADRRYWIQNRALGARERSGVGHREGCDDRAAAADETHAVGLERDLAGIRAMHAHQMKHPRYVLFAGARTARAENGVPPLDDLGLHEEIAECRMQCVRSRRCQNYLRVAGDFDRPRSPDRFVMWTRRTSISSSGETTISVCVSKSKSRRRNSARPSEKIAS